MKSGHLLAVSTHRKTKMRFNNSLKVSQYGRRLKKSRKPGSSSQSSLAAPAVDSLKGSTIKRRPGSTIREASICNVTMKVSPAGATRTFRLGGIRLEDINSRHRDNWKG